eukprot:Em0014g583a
MLHGLALEDSSPPWGLAVYSNIQIELMRQWGLNVVRLGFLWHMVEPAAGQYNGTYVQEIVDFIAKLNDYDIYVILDMHQDCWSPLYCNSHGIPSQYAAAYNTSNYQPGGIRAYPEPVVKPTYDDHGDITNCDQIGEKIFGWASCYPTYAIGAAAQRLYDNDEGIADRFGKMWQMIASKVAQYPNILGYELLNEPWLGDVPLSFSELDPATNPHWDLWFPTISDRGNLAGLYQMLHRYIRQVDNESIIFFEPATGGNFLDAWPDSTNSSNFIQWIVDRLDIAACDLTNDAMYDVRKEDTERLKLAGFLTEFGDNGVGVTSDYINFCTNKMDQFLHGWTFWYLTPDPSASNTSITRALAKPFPHKIAGTPIKVQFTPESSIFDMVYTPCTEPPCSEMATEVFVAQGYHYPNGFLYAIATQNTVSVRFNQTNSFLYIQVTKIIPEEPVEVILSPK